MSHLHRDQTELSQPPYDHFPIRGPRAKVNMFDEIQFGEDPQVCQLARLVHIMDQMHRCNVYELWETRRRLREAQEYLRIGVSMNSVPHNMLYGDNKTSPAATAPPEYRLLKVAGLVPIYGQRR